MDISGLNPKSSFTRNMHPLVSFIDTPPSFTQLPGLIFIALLLYIIIRVLYSLSTWKRRRRLLSFLLRCIRWELWPPYLFYPPVVLYYLGLSIRYRSLTLPSLANPGIPLGGWVESKGEILGRLSRHCPDNVGAILTLPSNLGTRERIEKITAFRESLNNPWPIVIKPDQGEHGLGVEILHHARAIENYLDRHPENLVVQEYHPGREFGAFFIRFPGKNAVTLFSLAEKAPIHVTGDGRSTLEELILKDRRAVCMAGYFIGRFPDAETEVPGCGETIRLTDVRSRSRGAHYLGLPLDGTEKLTAMLTDILRGIPGFHFGRFDLKAPSIEALKAGSNLKIIELNGLTSEALHVYQPYQSILKGYRVLFKQWKIAFRIGDHHRKLGMKPPSSKSLLKLLWIHLFRKEDCPLPIEPRDP